MKMLNRRKFRSDGDDAASDSSKKISKQEFLALVTAMAQALAGPGNTPSAFQFGVAQKNVAARLASRGVSVMNGQSALAGCSRIRGLLEHQAMGGDSDLIGEFWDQIKSAASATFDAAKKYGSYVLPFMPYVAAVPVAALAVQQVQKYRTDQRNKEAAAAKAAEPAPVVVAKAPEAVKTPEAPPETPAAETSGLAAMVGQAYLDVAQEALIPAALLKGKKRTVPRMSKEDREISASAGDAENGARKRTYYFPSFVAVGAEKKVPHDVYRAAIWKNASRLSGGKSPNIHAICKAQQHIDGRMAAAGATVLIPGARAGRVTR